jgi:L-ascorbate metabolism protein UlaG (beta-lactamase superfamily)
MKKHLFLLLLLAPAAWAADNVLKGDKDGVEVFPVQHASMVIKQGMHVYYVDPVGGAETYAAYPKPTAILITDIHKDHLDKDTVDKLRTDKTRVLGPKAVIDRLGYGRVVENGGAVSDGDFIIEAVPMYNTTPEREKRHPKGRGNGYVLNYKKKRLYISGDTEDTPEMRALKNIDYAFVCMSLPTTMSVEQAASAVLAFKPKVVVPYHHKYADLKVFKQLVEEGNKNIRVVLVNWYEQPSPYSALP